MAPENYYYYYQELKCATDMFYGIFLIQTKQITSLNFI